MERPDLSVLEDALGWRFRDRALLEEALTHASFCNETRDETADNERLEFLGDAVLSTVVAAAAWARNPAAREGDLTRIKASVVSEPTLATVAREVGLGGFLRLGRGAAMADKVGVLPSVLADALEAVIGAVFADGGFEAARDVVLARLGPGIDAAATGAALGDAKSALQVACLKEWRRPPRYEVTERTGPPHAPVFTVRVVVPDGREWPGTGRTKKEAEQAAAAAAIEAMA